MIATKNRRFLWEFLEECSIVAIYITALFHHHGTILFREGNVSTGDYSCYLCQRSDHRDWRIEEPFALLSQCSLTHYLHGIFPEEARRLRTKRPFLTPHLGLSNLIPKSLPIRELNEISTPSYAYQRGQGVIFLDGLPI
jgi:hypothetical protein